MKDESDAGKNKSRNDWLGIIGVIIGILGICLSCYFYTLSIKEKSLSVILDSEIIQIMDSKKIQSNKFSVVNSEGEKIENDIFALKLKIINDGDIPIWGKDILSPLRVKLYQYIEYSKENELHSAYILDYIPYTSEKADAIKSSIVLSSSEFDINFRILESGDFIEITVIFSGTKDIVYDAEGIIEGVKKIKTKQLRKNISPLQPFAFDILIIVFILLLISRVIEYYQKSYEGYNQLNRNENEILRITEVTSVIKEMKITDFCIFIFLLISIILILSLYAFYIFSL